MNAIVVVLIVILGAGAELTLTRGIVERVIFNGNVLTIRLNNPRGGRGTYTVCLESYPSAKFSSCPQGYAFFVDIVAAKSKSVTYYLTRQGQLDNKGKKIGGTVQFKADGSLNVLVNELPNGMTMTLVNGERFVPTITTTTKVTTSMTTIAATTEKEKSKGIVIGVIIGLVILAVGILSAILVWHCYCRKRYVENEMEIIQEDKSASVRKPMTVKAPLPKMTSTSTTKVSDENAIPKSAKPKGVTNVLPIQSVK